MTAPVARKCYGMGMRRTLTIITAAFLAAALTQTALDHSGATEQPYVEVCPSPLISEDIIPAAGGPTGAACGCPDTGEHVGNVNPDGTWTYNPIDDGDCSTPYPAVPLEEEPQPEARTQQTAPTLPGEPVYPVPPVPQTGGGPVQARPGLTG